MANNASDKTFITDVEVQADEQSLNATSRKIQDALREAVSGVDITALARITDNLREQGVTAQQTARQAEQLKQAIERTAQAEQRTAAARANTAAAQERLNQTLARTEAQQNRVAASVNATLKSTNAWEASADRAYAKQQSALSSILDKQSNLVAQLNQESVAAAKAAEAFSKSLRAGEKNFTVGNIFGAAGKSLLQNIFSGQGFGAVKSTLGELQGPLAQIAAGGNKAAAAFNDLGVAGAGATSGLVTGFAAVASGILFILPLIEQVGKGVAKAFEQQKDFVFQGGLVAKQLGITAQEGAKARALLTLIQQENNIFATITLNQIQASIAALDRVDKGLEKPTAQVAAFGKAIDQLGVSYKNQDGSLKNFVQIVGDLSAALEKLPAAQRSLAVQNLAGLFGGDVAKLFGFGPQAIKEVVDNAVVVSEELQKQNDQLQVAIAKSTAAQTQFNIALTNGLVPLQTWVEGAKQYAFALGTAVLQGGTPEARLIDVTNQIPDLQKKRQSLLAMGISERNLEVVNIDRQIQGALETQRKLQDELTHFGQTGGLAPDAPISDEALKARYKELDDLLAVAIEAEKEYEKIQKQIEQQNLNTAKSFQSQVDALQSAAKGYDDFFKKASDLYQKIGELRDKEGKPVTIVGAGNVKNLTKQLLDLQINEALAAEREPKADTLVKQLRLEKLRQTIAAQRAALGLQPGEATVLANVDIKVSTSKLSSKDKEKLEQYLKELDTILKEFVKDSFDTVQETFNEVLGGAVGNQQLFDALLRGGADTLQRYADSVGLLSSPGFTQAMGEAALKAQLLAGAFGDLSDSTQAPAAFDTYAEKLLGFRKDLAGLTDFVADPKKLTIPLAIEFGLITEGDVATANTAAAVNKRLKDALLEGGEFLEPSEIPGVVNEIVGRVQETSSIVTQQVDAQLAANKVLAAQTKIDKTQSGTGIVDLLLAKYGIRTGEAIKATAEFAIDANVDVTLAKRQADAEARRLQAYEDARDLNARWNLKVSFNEVDLSAARRQIEALVAALGGAATPPVINPTTAPPKDDTYVPPNRAFGGGVAAGVTYNFLEQGLPEIYSPYGSQQKFIFVPPRAGNVIGGNATMSLLAQLLGRERLPSQTSITYAPQVKQEINIKATGENAREVARAIQQIDVGAQFRSSLPGIQQSDLRRALGYR